MIQAAMAVATAVAPQSEAAIYARDARWARFAALVLDGIFLSILNALVNNVYGVTIVTSGYFSDSGLSYYTTTTTVPSAVLILLGFVYFIVSEAMFGATPGKQLMRVKVVRLEDGALTVRAVIVRNVFRFIDFLPVAYILGGVLVLATAKAQRLGDMAAGTAVVYRHRVGAAGMTRTTSPRARLWLAAALLVALIFSIGFDYFGRPPLVIEGMHNTHQLFKPEPSAYRLGQPIWGAGTVTYPISFVARQQSCTGTITLRWQLSGWEMSGATYVCPPS